MNLSEQFKGGSEPKPIDPIEVKKRNIANYLAEMIVRAAKGEITDEDFEAVIRAAKEDITRMRDEKLSQPDKMV